MSPKLPVLGLFKSEADLRDHVAARLETLEPGLELTKIEYDLPNPDGAGGRVDIVALDRLGHVVVIELKRSDRSARATLNELSKYVSLLINEARVPKEAIRCMVLSTDWHELRLPLSFFAATAGVHVEGLCVVRASDGVAYENVELIPITDQPQLSPEVSLFQYPSVARRDEHLAAVADRVAAMPFARLAVLKLDPPEGSDLECRSIACLWRLRLGDEERVPALTGEPIGHLEPYAFPGWEAECDALYWLVEDTCPTDCLSTGEALRGTPEKIANLLTHYEPVGAVRFGDWPRIDLINTQEHILRQLAATSSLTSSPRRNRYSFRQSLTKRIAPSWRRGVEAFLDFIAFEPVWADAAKAYLSAPRDPRAVVHLHAFDSRNPFYLLHQARAHPEATGSYFEIFVFIDGEVVEALVGHWGWDERTHPVDAVGDVERAYGSVGWATMSCFSAVDEERHERALYDFGFRPYVLKFSMVEGGEAVAELVAGTQGSHVHEFIAANRAYVDRIAEIFDDIPTAPPGTPDPDRRDP